MTAHAFCLAHAHYAGDTYSVPHVWVDRTDYTYKFAFYYNIITSHVSLLLTSWRHPSLAYFRPLPKASDDTRASFSHISDFQFNGTSLTFGKPSPPIRRLERQYNSFASQCVLYRRPMLLLWTSMRFLTKQKKNYINYYYYSTLYRVGEGRIARKFRKRCTVLRGNREMTEKYEYGSTVPRTSVQNYRLGHQNGFEASYIYM